MPRVPGPPAHRAKRPASMPTNSGCDRCAQNVESAPTTGIPGASLGHPWGIPGDEAAVITDDLIAAGSVARSSA
jgi:hypothetical protein